MRSLRKGNTEATPIPCYKLLIDQCPKPFINTNAMLRPLIVNVFCYIQYDFLKKIMNCIVFDTEDSKINNTWILPSKS